MVADMDDRVHQRADDVADQPDGGFLLQHDDAPSVVAQHPERDDSRDEGSDAHPQPEQLVGLDGQHPRVIGESQGPDSDPMMETTPDRRPYGIGAADLGRPDEPVRIALRVGQRGERPIRRIPR